MLRPRPLSLTEAFAGVMAFEYPVMNIDTEVSKR